MQERYSVSHKGQEIGPFSTDEILQKVKAGDLSALDYVYVDEKKDWIPLAEFMPNLTSVRPPATPPPTGKTAAIPLKPVPTSAPPAASAPASALASAPTSTSTSSTSTSTFDPDATVIGAAPMTATPASSAPTPSIATTSGPTTAPQAPLKAPPSTKPTPITAAATNAKTETVTEVKTGTINLKGGTGTLELMHYTAGTVTISLRDDKKSGLKAIKSEEVVVKAAPAAKFVLSGTKEEQTAGQQSQLTIEAVDKWGNRDSTYTGSVSIALSGTAEGAGQVKIAAGRGQLSFTSKKAETITARLVDSNNTGLDVTATCNVNFVAGPAEQLILTTPETVVAGQPVKVQVKAVDKYGNLATTCNEQIQLEMNSALQKSKVA